MKLRKHFKYSYILVFLVLLFGILSTSFAQDPIVAIGDISRVEGIRSNHLSGFGLVLGLAGTGDSTRFQPTIQSHANMLQNFGINVTPEEVRSRNVAAVMVTAELPPFAYSGDTIDIKISSIGDARSLQGGVLFLTPLLATDGDVYAVAQGAISIGGYNYQQAGTQVRENHPTVAAIPNGAIVEKELKAEINKEKLSLILNQENFQTVSSMVQVINDQFAAEIAQGINAKEVEIEVPTEYKDNLVDFIARINNLDVQVNIKARVVINERTGTVVFTHNVRLSSIAVAHGNIKVSIRPETEVHLPEEGETIITTGTEIDVEKEEGHLNLVPSNTRISDLVQALNTIGATPRDIVAIFQEIKTAGALHAELILN